MSENPRRPRRLQWGLPESPPPRHPYRDTLILYGAFACIIVGLAWVTGGPLLPSGSRHGLLRELGAVPVAIVFFAVASGWSLLHWRRRLREEAAQTEARRR